MLSDRLLNLLSCAAMSATVRPAGARYAPPVELPHDERIAFAKLGGRRGPRQSLRSPLAWSVKTRLKPAPFRATRALPGSGRQHRDQRRRARAAARSNRRSSGAELQMRRSEAGM